MTNAEKSYIYSVLTTEELETLAHIRRAETKERERCAQLIRDLSCIDYDTRELISKRILEIK